MNAHFIHTARVCHQPTGLPHGDAIHRTISLLICAHLIQDNANIVDSHVASVGALANPTASSIRPLKVALLGYRSNPYSGGQGVYLKYLSKALVVLGHEVDVISGEPYPELDERVGLIKLPGLNLFEHPKPIAALGMADLTDPIRVFEWASYLSGGFPEPYTFGLRLVRYFKRYQPRYDIVHDNQSLCSGLLGLQRRGYAVTTTIHHPITFDRDIALANTNHWLLKLLIRRWHLFLGMQTHVARQLQHICTVSHNSKSDIGSAFGISQSNLTVIHNGIDADMFRPQPQIEREPFHLITTASADQPLKGTQHLIPAVALLAKRFPKLKLTFIGAPKAGGATEQAIKKHDLQSRITFHHGISPEQIVDLYALASVAVVPSEYEGFGLPAGEAMACGVPLVSTDGGALPEVVGDAGLVVPAKDSQALAEAIACLFNDPTRCAQLGSAGRARIVQNFSWRQCALEMTSFYNEVIA